MTSEDRFSITVQRRVRPLRFGFVVDPNDGEAVRRAFEASTVLWGGRFNALIPLFRNAPPGWPPRPKTGRRAISPLDAANGYLAAFEPDYVVEVGDIWHDDLSVSEVFRKKESDLPWAFSERESALGLTVNSLFAHEYSERQQFVQKEPLRATVASLRGYELLSAAAFGAFSKQHEKTCEHYERTFSAETVEIGPAEIWEFLRKPTLTPIRAGALGLRRGWYRRFMLFFCDPTSQLDAIDLWDLRALGWSVFPLPEDWADASACDSFIQSYEDEGDGMMILKSFHSSRRRWNKFIDRLQPRPKEKLIITDAMPPIWAPRQGRDDGTARLEAWSSEDEIELTVEGGSFRLPVASPNIAPDDRFAGTAHWANDVGLTSLWDEQRATKLPPLREVSSVVSVYGRSEVSQISDGLAVRVHHRRERKFWTLPRHEQVVKEWMNDRGITMELSGAGRVSQQIVRALGGLRMTWLVGHIEVIEFLNSLAHTNVEATSAGDERRVRVGTARRNAVVDVLKRVARLSYEGSNPSAERLRQDADAHLKLLLERSVFRVGLKLQCPHCSQRNWYSLPDLDESLRCERCLQAFSFPVDRPLDADWEYRPIGPFSVENYAHGSYAAVLALRFLSFDRSSDMVWAPALELKGRGLSVEYDFAAFVKEHITRDAFTLVAGECKCGKARFLADDLGACRSFAETFPGGAFFFVTTRRELDATELRSIRALARRGWKLIDGRWRTPVVVLTRRELQARSGAPQCWKVAAEGLIKEYWSDYQSTSMERLARATQRLYLGLEPPPVTQR